MFTTESEIHLLSNEQAVVRVMPPVVLREDAPLMALDELDALGQKLGGRDVGQLTAGMPERPSVDYWHKIGINPRDYQRWRIAIWVMDVAMPDVRDALTFEQ